MTHRRFVTMMTMFQDEGRDPADGVAEMLGELLASPRGAEAAAAALVRLLERVEHLEAAVHAHSDLFQSIGVLVSVLGVSPGDAEAASEPAAPRTPPGPPRAAAD